MLGLVYTCQNNFNYDLTYDFRSSLQQCIWQSMQKFLTIVILFFLLMYKCLDNFLFSFYRNQYIYIYIYIYIYNKQSYIFQQNVPCKSRFKNSDFYLKHSRLCRIMTDVDFHSQDVYPTDLIKIQYVHHM